jgi:hypothetical protein
LWNIYIPEANLLAGALLCPGAGLLPVLRGDDAVIVPGIADVLQQSREHSFLSYSLFSFLPQTYIHTDSGLHL